MEAAVVAAVTEHADDFVLSGEKDPKARPLLPVVGSLP